MKNNRDQIQRFGEFILRYRWQAFIVALLVCGTMMAGLKDLRFTSNQRIYFSPDNPQNIDLDNLQNQFSQDEGFLLAIDLGPKKVFEQESLKILYEITEESWTIPNSTRVDSIANYMHSIAFEDSLDVNALIDDPSDLTLERVDKIGEIARDEGALKNKLFSDDETMMLVSVSFRFPDASEVAPLESVYATKALIKKYEEKYPHIKIHLGGPTMVGIAFTEAAMTDSQTLIPLMYLTIIIILFASFRSKSGVFITISVIVLSTGSALGIWAWFGYALNTSSVNAPTIIMTLAVADSVHFLMGVYKSVARGATRDGAIVDSLKHNVGPIFFTSITTAIGFFAMNSLDIPPFRDMGNIIGIGVLVAFLLSITFIPALLGLLPAHKKFVSKEDKGLVGIAEFVINHRLKVFFGSLLLVFLLGSNVSRLVVDDVVQKYFSKSIDFRIAADFIDEKLGSANMLEYNLSSGSEGGVKEPAYLRAVDGFKSYAESLPKVNHVAAVSEIFKKLNQNMHGDSPEYDRIPESRDLAAQYLLLFEMSLPFGRDLTNQINIDKSASRVSISTSGMSTRESVALTKKLDEWLVANAPASMHSSATGSGVVFANIYNENMDGMIAGTFTAFFLITICMIISLKSFGFAIVSMIPNAVPVILAYGVWYFINGTVGLATSVVAMASIGIVVDDTVHFLSAYVHARRKNGLSPEDSIRETFAAVGSSLWVTSVVLASGFLMLCLSVFTLNSYMGGLIAMTIVFALAADFFLLPAILLLVDRKGVSKRTA